MRNAACLYKLCPIFKIILKPFTFLHKAITYGFCDKFYIIYLYGKSSVKLLKKCVCVCVTLKTDKITVNGHF